jgi:hypothetical protein
MSWSWENVEFGKPIGHNLHYTNGIEFDYTMGGQIPTLQDPVPNSGNTQFFGEKVESISQMIRRPGFVGWHQTDDPSGANPKNTSVFSIFTASPIIFPQFSTDSVPLKQVTFPKVSGSHPLTASNFLLYFSRLFLAWRGEQVVTTLGAGEILRGPTGTKVAHVATESSGVMISNCTDRSTNEPIDMYPTGTVVVPDLDSYETLSYTGLMGDGLYYRPVNVPSQPVSVSVPYYTSYNYYLTPDIMKHGIHPRLCSFCKDGAPGVAITTTDITGNYTYLTAEAGDCFSLSFLFSPTSTDFLISPYIGIMSARPKIDL